MQNLVVDTGKCTTSFGYESTGCFIRWINNHELSCNGGRSLFNFELRLGPDSRLDRLKC